MRIYTNKLLDSIADGLISKQDVINACMQCMSEDDVKGMCESNEFNLFEEEELDEDDSVDGTCPECGEDISEGAVIGDKCSNCDHYLLTV